MRMLSCLLLALALVSGSAIMAQETPQPRVPPVYDTETFAQLPALEDPTISPNGKVLAGKIAIDGTQYFGIMPLDGQPRLVSTGETDLR